MNLKKELRITVKYILPKEKNDVIENYVDTLALINKEYTKQVVRKNIAREMIKSREIDFANGNHKAIISIDFIEKLMWDYHDLIMKKLTIPKSFTLKEIISKLEDSDHLDDAIMFFNENG